MSDDANARPILEYASRGDALSPDVPRELSLRFERPGPRNELATRCIAFAFVVFGGGLIAAILIAKLRRGDHLDPDLPFKLVVATIILVGLAWWCLHHIRRLWVYGKRPIMIELADGRIAISDPVQFGEKTIVLPVGSLRRCKAHRDVLFSPALISCYQIFLVKRRFETEIQLRVTAQPGIVERAAADLQRAIQGDAPA